MATMEMIVLGQLVHDETRAANDSRRLSPYEYAETAPSGGPEVKVSTLVQRKGTRIYTYAGAKLVTETAPEDSQP